MTAQAVNQLPDVLHSSADLNEGRVVSPGSEPERTQAREFIAIDLSNSTAIRAVRTQYLARAMARVDRAIENGAYLKIVTFAGAASSAEPVFEKSMQPTGPNTAFIQADERRLRSAARVKINRALGLMKGRGETTKRHAPRVPGSDVAGMAYLAVSAAKRDMAPGTVANVTLLTDGVMTFGAYNLVHLLRRLTPEQAVDRLGPFLPDARGVSISMRGIDPRVPGSLIALKLVHTWELFCEKARARTYDITTEV